MSQTSSDDHKSLLAAPLLDELAGVCDAYRRDPTVSQLARVRAALDDLSRVAHRAGLGPETLLILVKQAWANEPVLGRERRVGSEPLLTTVVTACIESYYDA